MRTRSGTETASTDSTATGPMGGDGGEGLTVVIDGRVVMHERNVLTLDEQEVLDRLQAHAQRLWEKNGFKLTQTFTHKDSQREFVVMVFHC